MIMGRDLFCAVQRLIGSVILIFAAVQSSAGEMSVDAAMAIFEQQRIGGLVVVTPAALPGTANEAGMTEDIAAYMSQQLGGMPMNELMEMMELQRIGGLIVVSYAELASSGQPERAEENSASEQKIHIYFDLGSETVDPSQISAIRAVCTAMTMMDGGSFELIGHADSIGERDYNDLLSLKRALNVRRVMEQECGLENEDIAVAGHGEQHPLTPEEPASGKNRRVEIRARSDFHMMMAGQPESP
ncbi:hypothetical protein AB838_22090 [Rhodobacteraceae bacterium (ex Bugula neritina AB1)]|nr:hypothetical protein AB838_22090 [Rhodobacteraceae bacterium (ex Bugula neritina AB1)]